MLQEWLANLLRNYLDPSEALAWCERIASIGIFLSAIETLMSRRQLDDDGFFSWFVQKHRWKWDSHRPTHAFVDLLFCPRAIILLSLIQCVCVIACWVIIPTDPLRTVPITVLGFSWIGSAYRSFHGRDGADQMIGLIFVSSALGRLTLSVNGLVIALWFIALQSVLSYSSAGVAKLAGKQWRDGSAFLKIMQTGIYGNGSVARALMRVPIAGKVVSYVVIVFELGFPIAFFGPLPLFAGVLVAGIIFHSVNAFVSGLNTFFWAFVATYPAVCFCYFMTHV